MGIKLVKNAAGRRVPTVVNGIKAFPYQGVGKFFPNGNKAAVPIRSCQDYPSSGNKVINSLKEALKKCGLKNGMTISNHHHFRNGDLVMNQVFDCAAKMNIKNLRWFPSASFPCHEPMINHMENGVIHHIEGSLNGPLGNYASEGKMKGMAVLRSHGAFAHRLFADAVCPRLLSGADLRDRRRRQQGEALPFRAGSPRVLPPQ